jgi:hydrogenase-4 component F
MSFLLAGRVLHRYGTPEIARVSGLLKVMPVTGGLFAAGILALTGVPPFGLFVSEFLLVRAAVLSRHPWLAAAILLFLLTAFISLLTHLNRMLYGDAPADVHAGERRSWTLALLMVPAAALVVLGVVLPAPLGALIHQSVAALMP